MEIQRGGGLPQVSCSSGGVCCGLAVSVIGSSGAIAGLLFVGFRIWGTKDQECLSISPWVFSLAATEVMRALTMFLQVLR